MNSLNKICAILVRIHSGIYTLLGSFTIILWLGIGMSIPPQSMHKFVTSFGPPITIFILIHGIFICSYFYGDQYLTIVPKDPLARISFGAPLIDTSFYETIISDIGVNRKIAGYLYALTKPINFYAIGVVFVFLFIQAASK